MAQLATHARDEAARNAAAVRRTQRIGHLAGDLQRVVNGELFLSTDAIPERLAFDKGRHIVEQTCRRARIEQRENMRVAELGRDLDFTHEPLRTQRHRQIGMQHLHRDRPLMLQVASEVHRGHPTPSNLALDGVTIRQRGPQLLDLI